MDSSSELSKTLDGKLSTLEQKASTIEALAAEVKSNEKRLYEIANSTLAYISQLKSQHRAKHLSSNELAEKLSTHMDKIERQLRADPSKASIDKTINDLQRILQERPSSSGSSGSSGAASPKPGVLQGAMNAITGLVTGSSRNEDPDRAAGEYPTGETQMAAVRGRERLSGDLQRQLVGGYRYSSPKKKRKKTIRKRSTKIAKGRNKTLTKRKRIKSHFTKTRRNSR